MNQREKITRVPRKIRKAALLAIRKNQNLEAVAEANKIADQINQVSFYEKVGNELVARPFELI